MADARYFLADLPETRELHTKEQLRTMFLGGQLRRSDMVIDDSTGLAHLLGDLLSRAGSTPLSPEMRSADGPREPSRPNPAPPPRYLEFRADMAVHEPEPEEQDDDDDDEEAQEEEHYHALQHDPGEEDEEEEEALDDEPLKMADDPTEYLLHRLHPSWFSYPKTLIAVLLLGVLGYYLHQEQVGPQYVLVAGGVAIFILINASLDRSTTDYFITTRRVEAEYGILGRNSNEVRVQDIRAIDVRMSGVSALLGIGNVDFSSSGGASVEVQFKNVRNPHRIKRIVRELQG